MSEEAEAKTLPALNHWDVKVGVTSSRKEVRGASFAGSAPSSLGRERAAVGVDVDPERLGPGDHKTCLALESEKSRRKQRGGR